MTLSSKVFIKSFFVLFIISLCTQSIELTFIMSFLAGILFSSRKINSYIALLVIPLLLMVLSGCISTQWINQGKFNLIKDLVYFSRPILVLYASYLLAKRILYLKFIFNALVAVGLLFAVYHLTIVLANLTSVKTLLEIRELGGKHNHIELISLFLLLFTKLTTVLRGFRKIAIFILITSIVLYFSRTMFLVFIIFYFGHKGYLCLNRKLFKGIVLMFSTIFLAIVVFSNIPTSRESVGIKRFVFKVQNSFTELFAPTEFNVENKDRRLLWERWRAYEAFKAIDQIKNRGIKGWLFGLGYGEQINLGIAVKLEGQIVDKVPSIHNGYVYVLFKTGLLGLFSYLLFISFLFIYHQRDRMKNITLNNMMISASVYLFITSFVVTGFFRVGEFSMFLIGTLLVFKEVNVNNQIIKPTSSEGDVLS